MKYINELGRGFFFGAGFGFVVLFIYSAYVIYIQAKVDANYRQNLMEIYSDQLEGNINSLDPTVLGYKVNGQNVVISSRAINTSAIGLGMYLRFTISYNDTETPPTICKQALVHEGGGGKYTHYQTDCTSIYSRPENIKSIDVHIATEAGNT